VTFIFLSRPDPGAEVVLHLHRLDDEEDGVGFDAFAFTDLDLVDRAGDRRKQDPAAVLELVALAGGAAAAAGAAGADAVADATDLDDESVDRLAGDDVEVLTVDGQEVVRRIADAF
jgi:hypothetical protein